VLLNGPQYICLQFIGCSVLIFSRHIPFSFSTPVLYMFFLIFRSLVVEAKAKDIPMAFLDPQVMSLDNIKFDRYKVLQ
jgi:hypothetical protein